MRSDKHSAVYMKPDAQLESYAKFGVVPCQVAFRKNWQRDYNSAHRSSSQQVKQRDREYGYLKRINLRPPILARLLPMSGVVLIV